jgi:GNAT superfamily N-acetyltransferase
MKKISFQQVESEEQRLKAKELILEYLNWLNNHVKLTYNLEFDIDAMVESDMSDFSKFSPPVGRFYLALYEGEVCGVGCLKKINGDTGELQRMYVLPAFRGLGIGRAILEQLMNDARLVGYLKLKLESLEFLHEAHSLYRSVGFKEIEPYPDNSMNSYQSPETIDRYYSITVFMECSL